MQSKAPTIAAYLAELPSTERAVIRRLDRLVRDAAPAAMGAMKYGMPTYEVGGRMIALSAQKNYYSFYVDPQILDRYRSDFGKLKIGKSCIRFKALEDGSLELLRKIVLEFATAG